MDVSEHLPLMPKKKVADEIRYIYHNEAVFRSFIDVLVEVAVDKVLLPMYNIPQVRASQRFTQWTDAWYFLDGFKDGAVAITGVGSKADYCNGNVSHALDVFWYNWDDYIYYADAKFSNEAWN